MLDGVFEQRLEKQGRYKSRRFLFSHRESTVDQVPETGPLDFQVAASEVDLSGEGHQGLVALGQGVAQQVADTGEQGYRRLVFSPTGQAHNGVEGVEQKMGMQLRLEKLDLSIFQLPLQIRSATLQAVSLQPARALPAQGLEEVGATEHEEHEDDPERPPRARKGLETQGCQGPEETFVQQEPEGTHRTVDPQSSAAITGLVADATIERPTPGQE